MKTDQDVGSTSLQTIASIWQVDDKAIKWVNGGFDWTPGSHLVRVRALRNESHNEDRWRVSVATDFVTSVPIEDQKFIEAIPALSTVSTSSTYSMQYPPAELWKDRSNGEDPKLSFFSSIYVDPDLVQWLPRFLAQEALVQVTNAEALSAQISELIGGKPDVVPGGINETPDEMLEVLSKVYAVEGKKRSRWKSTEEFLKIAENLGRSDVCFGMGDKSGVTLETPFGDGSALIRLRPEKHPQLGNGLLVTIQFPFVASLIEIAKWSAILNDSEANTWTDFPQLGCWAHDGSEKNLGLAHASFVPNALYKLGLATNFAIWSVARARWLRQEFFPELKDKSMEEIIAGRLGVTVREPANPHERAYPK